LEEPQDEHGNQRCPNLNLDGIGAGSDKGFDFEVLLQMLDENFNLPMIFVDGSYRNPFIPILFESLFFSKPNLE
jgi:hypothetical protein